MSRVLFKNHTDTRVSLLRAKFVIQDFCDHFAFSLPFSGQANILVWMVDLKLMSRCTNGLKDMKLRIYLLSRLDATA